jgi:hypothetical protein
MTFIAGELLPQSSLKPTFKMIHDFDDAGCFEDLPDPVGSTTGEHIKTLHKMEVYVYFGHEDGELSPTKSTTFIVMYQLKELLDCPDEDTPFAILLHSIALLSCDDNPVRREEQHDLFRTAYVRNSFLNSEDGRAALLAILDLFTQKGLSHHLCKNLFIF